MHLDSFTLMFPDALASALAGLLLLGAWQMFRSGPTLLWWVAASEINAIGLAILTSVA